MTIKRLDVAERTLGALAKSAYETAKKNGFHDDASPALSPGDRLQLIAGEITEAFEELRSGHDVQDVYYSYTIELEGVKLKGLTESQVELLTASTPDQLGIVGKPEGFPMEIADTVIRLFDVATAYGIDLESVVLEKMAFNATREYKHGRTF